MNETLRLATDLFGPLRVAVPDVRNRYPTGKIEEFSFLGIPKPRPFTTHDLKNRTGVIAEQEFLMVGRDHRTSIVYDLRSDSFVREYLKQDAVRQPAIYEVNPVHARAKGIHGTVYLGEHAFGNDAFLLEGINLVDRQARKETCRVFRIPQKPGDVRKVNQPSSLEGYGDFSGRRIGVDVVALAAFIRCGRG